MSFDETITVRVVVAPDFHELRSCERFEFLAVLVAKLSQEVLFLLLTLLSSRGCHGRVRVSQFSQFDLLSRAVVNNI